MDVYSNEALEKQLKSLLEQRLGWGPSRDWATKDFERLSVLIEEKTAINLSVTTLKRFTGKVKTQTRLSSTTLDAIAQFLGFPSWRIFVESQHKTAVKQNTSTSSAHWRKISAVQVLWNGLSKLKSGLAGLVLLGIILLGYGFIFGFFIPFDPLQLSEPIPFEIKKVSKGLPNTVIFKYDVSNVNAERFQIQQYWDESKRFDIEKASKEASSIYFYPGYFRAKLVIEDQIVEERDLYIASDGWLSAIENKEQPRYLLGEEVIWDGAIGPSEEVIDEIKEEKVFNWLSFFYLEEFEKLSSTNFTLETSLKNTLKDGQNICQKSRIRLIGTEGVISVHFSIPGCVARNRIYLNGKFIEGSQHDLSALGCDYSSFIPIQIEKEGMEVRIFKAGTLLFTETLPEDIGKIAGLCLSFAGAGEIDYVRLFSNEQVLIEEDFISKPTIE